MPMHSSKWTVEGKKKSFKKTLRNSEWLKWERASGDNLFLKDTSAKKDKASAGCPRPLSFE